MGLDDDDIDDSALSDLRSAVERALQADDDDDDEEDGADDDDSAKFVSWSSLREQKVAADELNSDALLPRTMAHINRSTNKTGDLAMVCCMARAFLAGSEAKWRKRLGPALNPTLLLGSLLSPDTGNALAAQFVARGRPSLVREAGVNVGMSPKATAAAASEKTYMGPARMFVDDSCWRGIERLASSRDCLWRSSDPLLLNTRKLLLLWFAAVWLGQSCMEMVIKYIKNLTPQQKINEGTAQRRVRAHHNARSAVLPIREPAADQFESLWSPDGVRMRNSHRSALSASKGNPGHVAFPAPTAEERTRLNQLLGYNTKRTEAERLEAKTRVPKPASAAELDAATAALQRQFARQALPAEPSPDAGGRRRTKKRASSLKVVSASSAATGKRRKSLSDAMDVDGKADKE